MFINCCMFIFILIFAHIFFSFIQVIINKRLNSNNHSFGILKAPNLFNEIA